MRISVLRPFLRNFISDKWTTSDGVTQFYGDHRWTGLTHDGGNILTAISNYSWPRGAINIDSLIAESPPIFLSEHWAPGHNIDGHDNVPRNCLSTHKLFERKRIFIRLEDEGLTVFNFFFLEIGLLGSTARSQNFFL